jgi:hypothetical protein
MAGSVGATVLVEVQRAEGDEKDEDHQNGDHGEPGSRRSAGFSERGR